MANNNEILIAVEEYIRKQRKELDKLEKLIEEVKKPESNNSVESMVDKFTKDPNYFNKVKTNLNPSPDKIIEGIEKKVADQNKQSDIKVSEGEMPKIKPRPKK